MVAFLYYKINKVGVPLMLAILACNGARRIRPCVGDKILEKLDKMKLSYNKLA
jgi:hypothetical protein